jgi:hypothetical protein
MTLAPKLPPGRANRKALQYAADIHRLRRAGYTFSAIRQALLDVGLHVSLSTVKREGARRFPSAIPVAPVAAALVPMPSPASRPADGLAVPARPQVRPVRRGHDIAEAFFKDRIDNPLIRAKELS